MRCRLQNLAGGGSKADGELHKDERILGNSGLGIFREKVVGDAIQKKKKKKETFRSQAKENSCGGREIRGVVVDMLTLSCLYNETVTKVCRLRTSPKHNTCIHEEWYIDQLK